MKEISMKSDFIVLAKNRTEILVKTQQIIEQSLKPNFVAFASIEKGLGVKSVGEIEEIMERIAQRFDGEIPFSLTRILETECIFRCVDICVRKCVGDYYSVLIGNEELPDYFNLQLDTIISNDKTYMIRPQEGVHGLVVHRKLHKHLGGSLSFDEHGEPYMEKITDKILNYAKEEAVYEWQN